MADVQLECLQGECGIGCSQVSCLNVMVEIHQRHPSASQYVRHIINASN